MLIELDHKTQRKLEYIREHYQQDIEEELKNDTVIEFLIDTEEEQIRIRNKNMKGE